MMWNSKALVFDLDDTLYPESSYFKAIFSDFCLIHGWPDSAFASLLENFYLLRHTQKDIFWYFLNENSLLWLNSAQCGVNEYREVLHRTLFGLYTGIEITLAPAAGAVEWIKFAHRNHMKVGVLTNGVVSAQRNKWTCLDLPHKAQIALFPAREFGQEKPHPEAFHGISKVLGVELSQMTFIGDRFENDLAYPIAQGATGILLSQQSSGIQQDRNWLGAPDLASAFSLYNQKVRRGQLN